MAASRKTLAAWCLYDWANSAFTTLVVTFVYAAYFSTSFAENEDAGTALWSRGIVVSSLLVAVLSALHGFGVPDFTIDGEGQTLGRAVLAALFLHINLYEAQTGYLPGSWDVLWSLSIEEVFYLGFPLVCVTLRQDSSSTRSSKPWMRSLTGP